MAFYNEITQYNTLTTTHCDNFNEVNQKLLENTLQNHQDIGNLNSLSTTRKDSLVSAVNEVKESIPSSTNINQTIDQKISTHNQLTTSHQDIRREINVLESKVEMMEDCTSGYIADHISIAVNKGIKRGYFMAVNVRDISEKNWGYDIEFRMGEAPRVIVFSTRSRTGETYIRELDTSTRAWSYDWQQLANTEQINVLSANKLDTMIEKPNQSLNQDLAFGTYHFQNATDGFPEGYTQDNDFVVCVYPSGKLNLNYQRRVLYDIRSDKIFSYRKFATSTSWNQLATTTKTDILFPYSSGFEKLYSTDASGVSKCNNFVTVNLNVIKSDNTEITSHDVIAVLPSGYRPLKTVFNTCFDGRHVKTVGVVVRDSGYVQTTSYIEGLKTLVGQISFYTE